MGGVAALGRALGHRVTGSDERVYPPMSTQLEALGIEVHDGYDPGQLEPEPDCVVIGNAVSRGNPVVETVLERGLRYTSGPQWLSENVLRDRWVLAVAGTHGKTTTSSMLAWMLEDTGLEPGFLIGGIPKDFGVSARLGKAPFFVVEADEYDTAFFDKRSKFVHYHPRTLVLNNLEFDHADIFEDLAAIETQFHYLVRTVPGNGKIIVNRRDDNLGRMLTRGCWTPTETFALDENADWSGSLTNRQLEITDPDNQAAVTKAVQGRHNALNALAAVAAARHAGVPTANAVEALGRFGGIKRRLECIAEIDGVRVYDDFAHHPTAISMTLEAVHAGKTDGRLIAVLEPRSNTMKRGVHKDRLAAAFAQANRVFLYEPDGLSWSLSDVAADIGPDARVIDDLDVLIDALVANAASGDDIVIMSNGGFGGLHVRLVDALKNRSTARA